MKWGPQRGDEVAPSFLHNKAKVTIIKKINRNEKGEWVLLEREGTWEVSVR